MSEVAIEGQKPTVQQMVATAYVLPDLMEKDAIKKGQDGIRKSLIKLDMAIHENAVQCLMHAEKHGDTSLFRRLLVEIVDAKSGYRRQGLIAWMRSYSPMELKGDTINLSGTFPNGEKRPFRIEEADKNPFRADEKLKEGEIKPLFRETLLSKVNLAIKEGRAALANTVNGKPVDASKPFYDGNHLDKVAETLDLIETNVISLSAFQDKTRDVRVAQKSLKDAEQMMAEATG